MHTYMRTTSQNMLNRQQAQLCTGYSYKTPKERKKDLTDQIEQHVHLHRNLDYETPVKDTDKNTAYYTAADSSGTLSSSPVPPSLILMSTGFKCTDCYMCACVPACSSRY